MTKAGALGGIRVLDFGQYIAGPMAAMFLGDQGADVIRVDPPGGPRFDTPANATWNRGKRSIVLDLKNADDLRTALDLVDSADVLIENFRPGVMQRLGLGRTEMTLRNPRLIYCSIPGFASNDPRANMRAWEGVLAAATACYAPDPVAKTGRPIYTAIPYPSCFGAFLAVTSIAMALNARERGERGQGMEVAMFNAMFNAVSNRAMKVWDGPKFHALPKGHHLLCKDNQWLMYMPGDKHMAKLLDWLGLDDLKGVKLPPNELTQRLAAPFRHRTASEWEKILGELGLEGVPCSTSAQWLHHPQAEATKIIEEYDDPVLGRFRGPGINVRLSETPGFVRSPRHLPDADRAQILQELKTAKPVSAPLGEEDMRGALSGVKVLDLCLFIAGPTCGRTLAEFGADVIKIDSPHRNPVNWHFDVNRGKRTFLLDLKQPEGLEIFWKLVDQADVVLQNLRKGAAEKIGIGYEQIRARRPDIVYCSINAYGQSGPYSHLPGVEVIAQAMTGMQTRFGGVKPAINPFNACDFGTGLLSAYGIALALLHRRRTGQGQHVDNALLFTASMLQSHFLQEYAGKQWNEVSGLDALGTGPLNRAYEAADGWFFLCARSEELQRCEELAEVAGLTGDALVQAMESRFRSGSASHWVSALVKAGCAAQRIVNDVPDLMDDPVVRAHGLSVTRFHEDVGAVTTTGPGARLARTPVTVGRASPRPGTDAASILREIGMLGEMERLVRERVVVVEGIRGSTAAG